MLTFFIAIVLIQNTQVMNIYILFWSISMSQIILLLLIVLISFFLGYLTHTLLSKK